MEFTEYIAMLKNIQKDYNYEQYYDEVIRPLLKESISRINNVKVIPTFDTRSRSEGIREKYKDVIGLQEGEYVWPDYVFVPQNYTMKEPQNHM